MNALLKIMTVFFLSFSAHAYSFLEEAETLHLEKLPAAIEKIISSYDSAGFYLADGYYETQSSAYYVVITEGQVSGYLVAEVLSYTQDEGYYLTQMLFSSEGELLTDVNKYDELVSNVFWSTEEVNQALPQELWID